MERHGAHGASARSRRAGRARPRHVARPRRIGVDGVRHGRPPEGRRGRGRRSGGRLRLDAPRQPARPRHLRARDAAPPPPAAGPRRPPRHAPGAPRRGAARDGRPRRGPRARRPRRPPARARRRRLRLPRAARLARPAPPSGGAAPDGRGRDPGPTRAGAGRRRRAAARRPGDRAPAPRRHPRPEAPRAVRRRGRRRTPLARHDADGRGRPSRRAVDLRRVAAAARVVPPPERPLAMSFQSPLLLLLLVAVPLVAAALIWFERRRARGVNAWASPALLPNIAPPSPPRRRYLPVAFFLLGLTLLLVGFARPEAEFDSTREGATVVLVIDVSFSMQAADVRPSRLRAARATALRFVDDLPAKYRIGVVTFAEHVSVPAPPTYDRERVKRVLSF